EEDDKAIAELQRAASVKPKLPFVHYNLGMAYLHKQDYERARDEFLKDVAVEPDVAFNYDELGLVHSYLGQDENAERNYRTALKLDSALVSSYFGLAKIQEKRGAYDKALSNL